MAAERTEVCHIPTDSGGHVTGDLLIPPDAGALVVFAHGSGSSRLSPRNRAVAQYLRGCGLATMLMELLTPAEEQRDVITREHRFDIALLGERVIHTLDWLDERADAARLPLGCFGASTGAAAAPVDPDSHVDDQDTAYPAGVSDAPESPATPTPPSVRSSIDPEPVAVLVAKQVPHVHERPTGDVNDPFAWLRDRDDADTIDYLRAENAHSDAWFAARGDLVEELFGEIRSRVQETDTSAPVPIDDWYYATRTETGLSYSIHCRGRSAAGATDEVLLDRNAEATGHEFFALGAFEMSLDHRLLAWSADIDGDEHYTLRIRDVAHGHDLDDEIVDTTWGGVAWSSDSSHLFYVEADEQERPYRVMRHRLGTAQADDAEVFVDHDERYFVSIGLTRSREMIVIHAGSKLSSENWILPAGDPEAAPVCVRPREPDIEYEVDHWGDQLVILTNDDAVDFRVMNAPVDEPGEWTEFVAHQSGRRITSIEPFADFLALHEWDRAQPQIRIVSRDGAQHVLELDTEPHDVEFGPNEMWDTSVLRLSHQSLTTPPRVVDVDVNDGTTTVVKQTPTPNIDLGSYVSERRWATADDGTQVPVDIVRHVDTPTDGSAACCVYAYGSYEVSLPPWFSVARLSLLDRGVVWALAHPRGGGELGRQWYLDGKLLAKRNTFTDTLAVCEHLASSGVAARERIAIRGGSAGGLLVGACITLEPGRFRSAVAEVPFVDLVTTMSDPTLPLTVTEWEEWGDPRDEPYASYMLGYSPYDLTTAAEYPALFVTAGLNDPRVSYHEPAKWVAKLRSVRTNDAPLLLRTELGAGHGGPSGRYESWRDEARVLTFLLETL